MMKLFQVLSSSLSLIIGGVIYMLFRSDHLVMFTWFRVLNCNEIITTIRQQSLSCKLILPEFVMYSIPDGFWMFSYIGFTLLLWDNKVNNKNALWLFIILITALLSEIGQFLNYFPGTFDLMDLLIYCLGFLLPIIFFTNKHFIRYEK